MRKLTSTLSKCEHESLVCDDAADYDDDEEEEDDERGGGGGW